MSNIFSSMSAACQRKDRVLANFIGFNCFTTNIQLTQTSDQPYSEILRVRSLTEIK